MEVTHWGWYYPVSNFTILKKVKTRTMTGVMHSIARLIWAYENKQFNPKFSSRLVKVVVILVFVKVQIQIHGCDIMFNKIGETLHGMIKWECIA